MTNLLLCNRKLLTTGHKMQIKSISLFLLMLCIVTNANATDYVNRVEVSNDPSKYVYGIGLDGKLLYQTPGTGFTTSYCSNGNTDYSIPSNCAQIGTSAALTTTRTWTLPLASSVIAGFSLTVIDSAGGVTSTNKLIVARSGSNTINGTTTAQIDSAYSGLTFISDGSTKWTYVSPVVSGGGGGGSGTVTSVALSVPSIFSVSGSPVTVSGTLGIGLQNQSANTIFSGPDTGSSSPTFTAMRCNHYKAIGAWCLLNTLIASNSANLSDTTSFTNAYTYYEIYLEQLVPTSGNAGCRIQIQSSSTFQTTGYVSQYLYPQTILAGQTNVVQVGSGNITDGIPCDTQTGTVAAPGVIGHFTIANVAGTTRYKVLTGSHNYQYTSGGLIGLLGATGYWSTGGVSATVTGIRVIWSGANISSGVMTIWAHN